jgi:murein DD-endopeptidase MepM/ murein hydrolase activator NlpD
MMQLRSLLAMALLAVSGGAPAQLGGFGCPLEGKPAIRQGDSEAKEGGRFNSNRGAGNAHGALDLNSTEGTPVKAALGGKASVADPAWDAMGGTIIIDHGEGAYTIYGHLASLKVAEGARVKKGEVIGTVGYTGNAAALKAKGLPAHLHFALIQAGQTGLADKDKPLRRMKDWGDMWKKVFDAQLTGPVNPGLFMGSVDCWTGSTTVGAPGEK